MAKEVIRPEQYSRVQDKSVMEDLSLELSEEQLKELSELYDGMLIHAKNAVFDEEEQAYYSRIEWNKIHKDQLKLFTA